MSNFNNLILCTILFIALGKASMASDPMVTPGSPITVHIPLVTFLTYEKDCVELLSKTKSDGGIIQVKEGGGVQPVDDIPSFCAARYGDSSKSKPGSTSTSTSTGLESPISCSAEKRVKYVTKFNAKYDGKYWEAHKTDFSGAESSDACLSLCESQKKTGYCSFWQSKQGTSKFSVCSFLYDTPVDAVIKQSNLPDGVLNAVGAVCSYKPD